VDTTNVYLSAALSHQNGRELHLPKLFADDVGGFDWALFATRADMHGS
jgi:hypothetical protein